LQNNYRTNGVKTASLFASKRQIIAVLHLHRHWSSGLGCVWIPMAA